MKQEGHHSWFQKVKERDLNDKCLVPCVQNDTFGSHSYGKRVPGDKMTYILLVILS